MGKVSVSLLASAAGFGKLPKLSSCRLGDLKDWTYRVDNFAAWGLCREKKRKWAARSPAQTLRPTACPFPGQLNLLALLRKKILPPISQSQVVVILGERNSSAVECGRRLWCLRPQPVVGTNRSAGIWLTIKIRGHHHDSDPNPGEFQLVS